MTDSSTIRRGGGRAMLAVLSVIIGLSAASSSRAAGLLVADGGLGGQLTIESHAVDVVVNNGIAVTTVTQVFRNEEDRQVEALYTFPVPKGASVSNFSMWINGQEMVGEVVEKGRAREIYNSYKARRQDPGLLEQTDYKTFEMRVFPIGPRAQQKVQVTYYQELDVDHDWATWVYPLASRTDGQADTRVEGTFSLNVDVKSAIPITEVHSPSHGDQLAQTGFTPEYFRASLELTAGTLSRDVVLSYSLKRPVTGLDLVASKQGREDGYFCLIFTPGQELEDSVSGMDYVFVLDVSGSMENDGKMQVSRDAILSFMRDLGPDDRFTVMAINVAPRLAFDDLRPGNDANLAVARAFLEEQKPRGGTVLNPAIQLAYTYNDSDRPLNVVVLSDGMTEQTERNGLRALIQKRPAGSRVFCIGVGNDVDRPILQQVADESGGLAAFLSRGDDLERQAAAFRRKLSMPAATNVSFSFAGRDVYDVEPERIPNLYHGQPVRLYGRYRKGGDITVTLTADIQGRTVSQPFTMSFPTSDDGNPEIDRMWAWHRMQRLQRSLDESQGGDRTAREEIVRLGEGYSIVSEHTSFLVLENDAEYKRWSIDRKNALRIANDHRAQQRSRDELEKLRGAATDALGPDAAAAMKAPAADAATPTTRQGSAPGMQPTSAPTPQRNGQSVNMPMGGGGAIGPIPAILMLSGIALFALRRRRVAAA